MLGILFGPLLLGVAQAAGGEAGPAFSDLDGTVHLKVSSETQSRPLEVRLLVPRLIKAGPERVFLYVLPVEKQGDREFGDGLAEARRLALHEKYGWIIVAPEFAELPWYADHPSDRSRRDESYLLSAVLPLVEKRYPSERPRRLLLGFSKSGWGAWTLLLRNPHLFDSAVAWDAPLMKEKPDQFGMDQAFGSQENFDGYRVTTLLRKNADLLRTRKRLAHFGYGNFRDHHRRIQELLTELNVPVEYRDGPQRKHLWSSGWMPEAAAMLEELSR